MGVTFEGEGFVFDFEHDGVSDIIRLTDSLHTIEAFGHCMHYSYEFADGVSSSVRAAFIKHFKFPGELASQPEITKFIRCGVDKLHKVVNLYDYDLVVVPQSSSEVNNYMVRYLYRFAQPRLRKVEVVKSLPSAIDFDYDGYAQAYLSDVLEDGRPRHTEAQKSEVLQSIRRMMDLVHEKDYFTIAQDVKKSKLRPFVMGFLKFASEEDRLLFEQIRKMNILVVDDICTSGSTINELLRVLRILNEDNNITVFSLLGRQDLMAD